MIKMCRIYICLNRFNKLGGVMNDVANSWETFDDMYKKYQKYATLLNILGFDVINPGDGLEYYITNEVKYDSLGIARSFNINVLESFIPEIGLCDKVLYIDEGNPNSYIDIESLSYIVQTELTAAYSVGISIMTIEDLYKESTKFLLSKDSSFWEREEEEDDQNGES